MIPFEIDITFLKRFMHFALFFDHMIELQKPCDVIWSHSSCYPITWSQNRQGCINPFDKSRRISFQIIQYIIYANGSCEHLSDIWVIFVNLYYKLIFKKIELWETNCRIFITILLSFSCFWRKRIRSDWKCFFKRIN